MKYKCRSIPLYSEFYIAHAIGSFTTETFSRRYTASGVPFAIQKSRSSIAGAIDFLALWLFESSIA